MNGRNKEYGIETKEERNKLQENWNEKKTKEKRKGAR